VEQVDKIDDITQEKIREWQMRRLEIKDRMQSHPDQTLELSRVLDLMDDEHAAILAGATFSKSADVPEKSAPNESSETAQRSSRLGASTLDLQLKITANNADDLRKLLDIAIYEMNRQIDMADGKVGSERRKYPGAMSGTLGDYHFELGINDEAGHE